MDTATAVITVLSAATTGICVAVVSAVFRLHGRFVRVETIVGEMQRSLQEIREVLLPTGRSMFRKQNHANGSNEETREFRW